MKPGSKLTRKGCEDPPIIQYWHTERPPGWIHNGLRSFGERNPGMRHLVFDQPKARAFIAAHLSAREEAAFQACAVPAMQADYFRYCAVFALGGLYTDADMRCIADVRPLIHQVEGTLFGRQDMPKRVAAMLRYPYPIGPVLDLDNSPFAFREPRHPLLKLAIEVATANIENRLADGPPGIWLTAGQGVFTSLYLLKWLGSIDAFRKYVNGSGLKPSADLFCEVIGSHSVVASAMTGVAIRPRRERNGWLRPLSPPSSGEHPPHWTAVEGSIFR